MDNNLLNHAKLQLHNDDSYLDEGLLRSYNSAELRRVGEFICHLLPREAIPEHLDEQGLLELEAGALDGFINLDDLNIDRRGLPETFMPDQFQGKTFGQALRAAIVTFTIFGEVRDLEADAALAAIHQQGLWRRNNYRRIASNCSTVAGGAGLLAGVISTLYGIAIQDDLALYSGVAASVSSGFLLCFGLYQRLNYDANMEQPLLPDRRVRRGFFGGVFKV